MLKLQATSRHAWSETNPEAGVQISPKEVPPDEDMQELRTSQLVVLTFGQLWSVLFKPLELVLDVIFEEVAVALSIAISQSAELGLKQLGVEHFG